MYEFEKEVILFLTIEELESQSFDEFRNENDLKINGLDISEGTASIYVDKDKITIPFILELEDVLDSRTTLSSSFLGSSETIRSLGLD